jgi:hypothetical protein
MIKDLFPTHIIEIDNILESTDLQSIYDFVIINHNDIIVTPLQLPALTKLKDQVDKHARILAQKYHLESVEVSNRFCTHYFPPGQIAGMETHSDDLGDYGRKFIAFFYLEADQSASGELEIFDPRWVNSPWRDISNGYKVKPKTNKLVIFPTFLWHQVNSYFSETCPRMAIDVVIRAR